MSIDWGSVITGLAAIGGLSGLVALISFIVFAKANKRKLNAEAKKLEAEAEHMEAETEGKTLDTAFKMIDLLSKRVDGLETENKSFKNMLSRAYNRIEILMRGIRTLIQQLQAAGLVPCWEPDEWDQEA